MAPPSYADLGKNARDLFSKGYNFGFIKIDSTTKAHDNAEFKMAASHNIAASKMSGNLDLKYKVPKYGLTLTEKWNTDSVFGTELCLTDQGCKGTKITLDSTYSPVSAAMHGAPESWGKNDQSELGGSVYHRVNDQLEVAATAGYASQDKSTKFGLAALYKVDKDWTVRAKVSQSSQLAVATCHRLNEHLKATFSAQVNMANFNEGGHKFGVGFEYDPCC